jgi:hypothetical protein
VARWRITFVGIVKVWMEEGQVRRVDRPRRSDHRPDGSLDEIGIYHVQLSSQQVAWHFHANH